MTTLLPVATALDSARLTPAQRALLFDHLSPTNAAMYPDFVTAILRFAAETGEEHALAGTEQLAAMVGYTVAQRRVRAVARECLPKLEKAVVERHGELSLAFGGGAVEWIPSQPAASPARLLSPEAQAWLAEVDAESGKTPGMRFGFLLATWGSALPFTLYHAIDGVISGQWFKAILSGLSAGCVSQAYRLTLTPQQARLASKLANVDDVQAVGPLAEMITWPDERIKSMAMAALIRLLPRMMSSDTQLLSSGQRASLYQTLRLSNARRHAEFLEALLKALEQVGDIAALPYVRSLADSEALTLRQKRVVEAAKSCLPFLEGCAEQNRNSQMLLRATCGDGLSDERLLRPVGSQTAPNSDLLVRVAPSTSDPG